MTEPQTPPTEGSEALESDDDATLEKQSIEHEGKRMVPEAVVREQRERRRAAESKAKDLESKLSEFEKLKTFATQATPLLQQLQLAQQKNPELVQQLFTGRSPAPPSAAQVDDELVAIAKDLDLYDASGKPDLERAERIRQRDRHRTESLVQDHLKPVQESSLRQQAEANYHWMLTQPSKVTGKPIPKDIVDSVVSKVNLQDLANREYAAALWATARGVYAENQPGSVPPVGQEPLTVESAGGEPRPVSLSDFQKSMARESNRSESDVLKDLERAVESGGVLE